MSDTSLPDRTNLSSLSHLRFTGNTRHFCQNLLVYTNGQGGSGEGRDCWTYPLLLPPPLLVLRQPSIGRIDVNRAENRERKEWEAYIRFPSFPYNFLVFSEGEMGKRDQDA